MKKCFSFLLILIAFSICSFAAKAPLKIGVLVPNSTGIWKDSTSLLREQLVEAGFEVTVRIAGNSAQLQNAQMKELIEMNMRCIIVTPVDTAALSESVEQAQKRGIAIIAFDRLLENTRGLSFYVGNNNQLVGKLLGDYIVERFNLSGDASKHYTIEFFTGPIDDSNSRAVYDSLMQVLRPYLTKGQLVCRSGQTNFQEAALSDLSGTSARQRCEDILSKYYMESHSLDICCSTYDIFSYGVKSALSAAGYSASEWPVITGVNAETEACRNIVNRSQTATVLSDYRVKVKACVNLVESLFHGVIAKVTDKGMANGSFKVDAFLSDSVIVDLNNISSVVVDSGYIGRNELGL